MRQLRLAWTVPLLLLLGPPAALASTANDICSPSANPCLVTTDITVTPNSMLDFGTRALQVRSTGRLRVGSGTLVILAGSVRVEPTGLISGASGQGIGANVDIQTTGDIRVEGNAGGTGRIEVTANLNPGNITLTSTGGNVVISGQLKADGAGINGTGGGVTVQSSGTVDLSGSISARGGVPGLGGGVSLTGDGIVTLSGPISAQGGDGGDIDVESTGSDVIINAAGDFNVSAGGTFGDGGAVNLIAHRHVTLNGTISGGGAGSETEGGGVGANVTITTTTGTVSVNALQDLHGAAPDGEGGDVDILAALDATFGSSARFFVQCGGVDACGGFFSVSAGRNASLGGDVDVTGGFCGGEIEGSAGQQLTITSDLNADAPLVGGIIGMDAPLLTTSGRLHASGTGTFASGGFIGLSACDLTQLAGSSSSSTVIGGSGQNLWQASGQMTIGGTLRATGGTNRLEYRQTPPAIQGTATITPAATIVQVPTLPVCTVAACGNGTTELGEECDDSNTLPCDGCSPSCDQEVCGNGVVDCNEECDAGPGNGAPGSQCDTSCRAQAAGGIVFIPGSRRGGCVYEWAVVNPDPEQNTGALPDRTQTCIDGDPSCDADRTDDGGCDFTLSACLNVVDERLTDCDPEATEWVNVRRPSPLRPADTIEQTNATRLIDALKALGITVRSEDQTLQSGVPDAQRDHCTAPFRHRVPHAPGVSGRRYLHATGKDTAGSRGRRNRITLTCAPNPSICGNGVTEVTETCDDGNTAGCDGCSAACQIERCGDGIIACGEQCDDGITNGTPGAACSAQCTAAPPALRIPAGRGAMDCVHTWSISHGSPTILRSGLPSTLQICTDGDPSCDFDPTPGSCRFHLWECVGGADDRIGCVAQQVASAEIQRPGPTAIGPPATVRQSLLTALGFIAFPAGPGEVCGGRADLDVPAGRKRLVLRAGATTAAGRSDRDTFRLGCTP